MSKYKHKLLMIDVTQDDIDQAVPVDSGHCAIADAIQRQVPDALNVSVDLQTIRWSNRAKGERYVYLTPRVAQALLLDFDQGERAYCQPLTIRLQAPAQVIKIRAKDDTASRKARRADSAAKLAAIEAKVADGVDLTSTERRQLSAYRNNAARAAAAHDRRASTPRVTAPGPRIVESVDDVADTVVVTGGQAPVLGALASGQGKVRRFGVKSAGSPKPAN